MTQTPTDALRLVPMEPTEAMLREGAAAVRDFYSAKGPYAGTHAMWTAMLTAAPASPLPEGGVQCSGISGELSGWQDISTFTESGQGNPVIVAVPTKEGGWIVGEAWKCVMETDDAYRGNDGWWWAGTSPGDAYNDPIRLMNHGDAEWWMPLPAAPKGEPK